MPEINKKVLGLSGRAKEKLIQKMLEKRQYKESHAHVNVKRIQRRKNIPEAWYRFEQFTDYQQICMQKAAGKELAIPNPFFRQQTGVAGKNCIIDNQEYINFASYNYLGLNGDPRVSEAAKLAIDEYGTSVSASRLVSGERLIHQQLEQALTDNYGTEDSVVFVSGHATNVSTIGYLFGANDLVLYDSLSHNSIVQGALLSGAHRKIFPHNDWQAVDKILTQHRMEYERVLIVIEGLYSMDGDYPPLPEFIKLKHRHKAVLMVDEAHSLGVLGAKGQGISAHFDSDPKDIDICMGTLSKTLASAGGYITGERALIELLRTYAPGFLYSVGIPPASAAASLAALEIMHTEPQRVQALQNNGQLFLRLAKQKNINTGISAGYAVIPVIVGSSIKAGRLANAMFQRGVNVQPIFYPAVEEKSARLRFFISNEHTADQIVQTINILAEELEKLN